MKCDLILFNKIFWLVIIYKSVIISFDFFFISMIITHFFLFHSASLYAVSFSLLLLPPFLYHLCPQFLAHFLPPHYFSLYILMLNSSFFIFHNIPPPSFVFSLPLYPVPSSFRLPVVYYLPPSPLIPLLLSPSLLLLLLPPPRHKWVITDTDALCDAAVRSIITHERTIGYLYDPIT